MAVVVDQFEEVFTYRPQNDHGVARFEQDRNHFFANLLQAAATPGGRVAVVLTMRSDFWSACAVPAAQRRAEFRSRASRSDVPGGPTRGDREPAFCVGCEVEPALDRYRLLADVEGQPGALPLLQFALTEVWKHRDVPSLHAPGIHRAWQE